MKSSDREVRSHRATKKVQKKSDRPRQSTLLASRHQQQQLSPVRFNRVAA
ncbi:hypothetical protein [Microcoleus sp. K4-B3]